MAVAGLNMVIHNEYAPGVGITEGAKLNQAAAWGSDEVTVSPHFAYLRLSRKRGVF